MPSSRMEDVVLACGVQFMRMAHPARLVAERYLGRNG